MTRYAPLWQQAGSYAASQDRSLLSTIWPSGGVMGGTVSAVSNTMNLQATPGTAAVVLQAGQGVALCRWDAVADSVVTIPPAPTSNSRIDLYIIQVRDNAIDAGANNDFVFTSVQGTVAAAPVAPAVPANALALAQVTIAANIANLNAAPITARSTPLVPGGTTPAGRLYNPNNASGLPTGNTVLTFQSTQYARGGMVVSNNGLVMPVAGLYHCAMQANLGSVPSGQTVIGYVLANGANLFRGTAATLAPPAPMVNASEPRLLAAGDLIQAAVNINTGSGTNIAGTTADLNFLSVAYLGP